MDKHTYIDNPDNDKKICKFYVLNDRVNIELCKAEENQKVYLVHRKIPIHFTWMSQF